MNTRCDRSRKASETIAYGVADAAISTSKAGRALRSACVHRRRADNARTSRQGALGDWDALRQPLNAENGRLMHTERLSPAP